MKRFPFVLKMCFACFLALVTAVVSYAQPQPTAQVDNNAGTQAMPPYSGPKARIAVADFDVKAAKANGEIGTGLREMMVTALMNSNRFRVVERQVLNALMQEQELASSGAAQAGGVQRGQIKTADIMI
ncbi:MAG TPA: CsgG/HfaB family protein, partial [Candidatus Omnitrophota bacterium]|nr:CsgG/HfaB family protein [Candidatus Omnitrophota bacterium]